MEATTSIVNILSQTSQGSDYWPFLGLNRARTDAATGQLKVVTATTPPTGSPTWTYADAFGRTRMTLSRAFDSQYVKTLMK
jgi:hypothetical protein